MKARFVLAFTLFSLHHIIIQFTQHTCHLLFADMLLQLPTTLIDAMHAGINEAVGGCTRGKTM